jgi:hypothetical protein
MSHLLDSGRVGIVDKGFRNLERIYDNWMRLGFLDGIEDDEVAAKAAVSFEIAALMLLTERKMADIYFKLTGNIVDADEVTKRVETVLFPIIRRVIVVYPKAHEHVDDIVSLTKGAYDMALCKAIYNDDKSARIYLFEHILPKWSKWHRDREHKTYDEYKKHLYEKYVQRCYDRGSIPVEFEEYPGLDWEVEFCAAVAERIEQILREKNGDHEII